MIRKLLTSGTMIGVGSVVAFAVARMLNHDIEDSITVAVITYAIITLIVLSIDKP
jgi:hypothetical protein